MTSFWGKNIDLEQDFLQDSMMVVVMLSHCSDALCICLSNQTNRIYTDQFNYITRSCCSLRGNAYSLQQMKRRTQQYQSIEEIAWLCCQLSAAWVSQTVRLVINGGFCLRCTSCFWLLCLLLVANLKWANSMNASHPSQKIPVRLNSCEVNFAKIWIIRE